MGPKERIAPMHGRPENGQKRFQRSLIGREAVFRQGAAEGQETILSRVKPLE